MARRVISKAKVKAAAAIYARLLLIDAARPFDIQMINAVRKKKLTPEVVNEQVLPEIVSIVSDLLLSSGYSGAIVEKVLSEKTQCFVGSEPERQE